MHSVFCDCFCQQASKSVTMKHSLKILTALTQLSKRVCEEVVRNDGELTDYNLST